MRVLPCSYDSSPKTLTSFKRIYEINDNNDGVKVKINLIQASMIVQQDE